jgi:hypothetical protein
MAASAAQRLRSSPVLGSQNSLDFGNFVPVLLTPVLAKHTKSFNLIDTLSVGVDRIQRTLEPLQRQVETGRQAQITDATAKLILYSAFVDGKLETPRVCCRKSTGSISSRSTRNSQPGPGGACRAPLSFHHGILNQRRCLAGNGVVLLLSIG